MRRVSLIPDWQGPCEQWSRKFVAAHYWRVKHTLLSVDDAVQECGFVFSKICNRYSSKVTEPKWFFTIFKVSVINHFHSINRKQQHYNYHTKKANGRLETISENFFPTDGGEERQIEHATYGDQSLVDFWLSASNNLKKAINSEIMSGSDDLSGSENFNSLAQELQFLLGGGVIDAYIVKPLTTNTKELAMATKKKATEAKVSTVEKNPILADIIAAIRKDNDPKFAVQASDEVHQDYLKRVIAATGKISDDAFDQLPQSAQDWFNDAAPFYKKGKVIPLPPGFEVVDAAEPTKAAKPAKAAKAAKPEVEEVEDAPDPAEDDDADPVEELEGDAEIEEGGEEGEEAEEPEGDAVHGKAPKAKAAKQPAQKKERKNLLRGFSVVDMRREVIRNPSVTVAQLQEIAKGKGEDVKKSTITIARATTLTVIKLMKEEGRWNDAA